MRKHPALIGSKSIFTHYVASSGRLFAGCLIGLALVGCSRARLETAAPVSAATTSKATYCSQPGVAAGSPLNLIFVVDMSMSNIGSIKVDGQTGQNSFDPSTGTDNEGQRFQAIEEFIQSCGSQQTRNRYAIVGFSNFTFSSAGVESCSETFIDNAKDALTAAKVLRSAQEANLQSYKDNPYQQFDMRETNYSRALSCIDRVIKADLRNNVGTNRNYQVFFVTDGEPTRTDCTGGPFGTPIDPKDSSCYTNQIEKTRAEAELSQATLKIQPIFYGNTREQNEDAARILEDISQAGGVEAPLFAQKLNEVKLCEYASAPSLVRYRKQNLLVLNLNLIPTKGGQVPDSDSDGLADSDEDALGYLPENPRTHGILDKICNDLGGPSICLSGLDKAQCLEEAKQATPFKLTSCDQRALGLAPGETSVDHDGDSIVDYVEVIRNTQANLNDKNFDLDGDGRTNQQEIAEGTPVDFPESADYDRILYSESRIESADDCPQNQEAWQLDLQRMPLKSGKPNIFGKRADENRLLVVYRSSPENSESPEQFWAHELSVSTLGGNLSRIPDIFPKDFRLIGEVDP
ncbi:MAG: hypothetical protein COT74_02140 [Bdellovibrionales bacterium CG10_big_fil_rev_8_21_14_0_10_45_34]|nr:MAG: hypothetical protein COT74_02140 [Bdellovibrionales bacterium CG10_big_fil_rev_8_21_14_0_10_45_34]